MYASHYRSNMRASAAQRTPYQVSSDNSRVLAPRAFRFAGRLVDKCTEPVSQRHGLSKMDPPFSAQEFAVDQALKKCGDAKGGSSVAHHPTVKDRNEWFVYHEDDENDEEEGDEDVPPPTTSQWGPFSLADMYGDDEDEDDVHLGGDECKWRLSSVDASDEKAFAAEVETTGRPVSRADSYKSLGRDDDTFFPDSCFQGQIMPTTEESDPPVTGPYASVTRTPNDSGLPHLPPSESPERDGPRSAWLSESRFKLWLQFELWALEWIAESMVVKETLEPDIVLRQRELLLRIDGAVKLCGVKEWTQPFCNQQEMGRLRGAILKDVHEYECTQEALARLAKVKFQSLKAAGAVSPWYWDEIVCLEGPTWRY